MAQDRFVYWKKKKPTVKELRCLLEDYLGGAMAQIQDTVAGSRNPWWAIKLAGRPSAPWRRVKGYKNLAACMEMQKERWFEVCVSSNSIDVMTRLGDEYTSVVAEGFASLVARMYETKVTR